MYDLYISSNTYVHTKTTRSDSMYHICLYIRNILYIVYTRRDSNTTSDASFHLMDYCVRHKGGYTMAVIGVLFICVHVKTFY